MSESTKNRFLEPVDLSDITPRAPKTENPNVVAQQKAASIQIGKETGFSIDNLEEKPIRAARGPVEPPTFLKTLRLQVRDYNKFQTWCNKNRLSQKKGFALLAAQIPKIDLKGVSGGQ